MTSKKHKRFDSLVSDQFAKKDIPDYTHAFDKLTDEEKKTNKKKKCKTQGEESIQKLLTETGKTWNKPQPKWKKDKENNNHVKLTTELSKTTLTFKKEGTLSQLKMKRLADKLHELTNQNNQKKKTRLKNQK